MRARNTVKNKKTVHNTSNQQIHVILHDILFKKTSWPEKTSFSFNREQSLQNVMAQIERDCPEILESKEAFLGEMLKLYEARADRTGQINRVGELDKSDKSE